MANLFWKQKGDKTLNLLSSPFASEEEFEKVIFQTKEILEGSSKGKLRVEKNKVFQI